MRAYLHYRMNPAAKDETRYNKITVLRNHGLGIYSHFVTLFCKQFSEGGKTQ